MVNDYTHIVIFLKSSTLVNPWVKAAPPFSNSFWEPKCNLLSCALDRIIAINDIPANINGIITTDGSRNTLSGVGGSNDFSSSSYNILALPNHCNNRSRDNVRNKPVQEGLCRQISIELLGKRTTASNLSK
ncbi:UNVERIFIED_CONTAM: hypothetical protein Sradi_3243300 [Sesamum radiatum]|uniref:Uncharacterized protein n=1 Tax=Sesamum radiatum TaxID=300843 RepID=A0AAW2QZZ2_SESRA